MDSRQRTGLIIIVLGIGIPLLLFFFAQGYHSRTGFRGCLDFMEIVIASGEGPPAGTPMLVRDSTGRVVPNPAYRQYGRLAIPYKPVLICGILAVIVGGIVMIWRREPSPCQEPAHTESILSPSSSNTESA